MRLRLSPFDVLTADGTLLGFAFAAADEVSR
jgi:hypothetical protein